MCDIFLCFRFLAQGGLHTVCFWCVVRRCVCFPWTPCPELVLFPWWIPCPRGSLVSIPGGHQAPAVFMRILRRSTVFILLVFEIMFILSCTDFLPVFSSGILELLLFQCMSLLLAAQHGLPLTGFFVCVWVFGWTVAVTNPAARACCHARSCSRVC